MKYAFAALALAAGAIAGQWNGTVVYTTDVVTSYTTYCPEATTITHGTWTYTATASETLTITDCPCTITKPVSTPTPSTILYTSCLPSSAAESTSAGGSASASSSTPTTTWSNPLTVVWSTPVGSGWVVPTGGPTPSTVPFKGAASANKVGAVMVGAVAGVVALAL